ncbi:MAG: bifunctional demethylmenaquinone methyltransferase/2-methoxy-6-polyprenyl-1,4-benzoquinol methylase UbiE [Planctomycetota bacterium]
MTEPASDPPANAPPTGWSDRALQAGDNPHQQADKARRVCEMFSAIAGSYDRNNRLHSLGVDVLWRRKTVAMAQLRPGEQVVDVACGTGDLSRAFAKAGAGAVAGVDFAGPMLQVAHRKPMRSAAKPAYALGDAMRLPIATASADVVSIAFGIRNVVDWQAAIREFRRVLRPGGRLVILEFDRVRIPVLGPLYRLYTERVMPRTAGWLARDGVGAYRYLPRSVATFVTGQQLAEGMAQAGFQDVVTKPLALGAAAIHRGRVGPAG